MYFFRISLIGVAWIVSEDEGDCNFLVGRIGFMKFDTFLKH